MNLANLPMSTRVVIACVVVAGSIVLAWHEMTKAPLKTPDVEVQRHAFTLGGVRYRLPLPKRFALSREGDNWVTFSVPDTRAEPAITLSTAALKGTADPTDCRDAKAGHLLRFREDTLPNGNGPQWVRIGGVAFWGPGEQALHFTVDAFSEHYTPKPGLYLQYLRLLTRVSADGKPIETPKQRCR